MSTATTRFLENIDTPDNKWANTAPEVHAIIRARWSPRAFSDRPVSDQDLHTILEAARWAASSYNEQPWRFIVGRKSEPADFQRLLSLLLPTNQSWAKNAPVLLIMAAKKTFSHNGVPNQYALHDAGQAFANMALQATALGLHVHGMAGFDHQRARTELGIPEDFDLGAAVAIGYRGEPDILNDQQRAMELADRSRKPLAETVFLGSWGNAGL